MVIYLTMVIVVVVVIVVLLLSLLLVLLLIDSLTRRSDSFLLLIIQSPILHLGRRLNSYPHKGTASFQTKIEAWMESMKLEFPVMKHGRHGGEAKKKPGYISHPNPLEIEKQKRKLEQEEGEKKRRRKSEEEKEVY